jgi:predicted amidohydrolase
MKLENEKSLVVALVQMSMVKEPEINLNTAINGIRSAKQRGADIVCLPELFRSPYFCLEEKCETDFSEELPGQIEAELSNISKELEIVLIAGSIFEKTTTKLFNTSIIFDQEGKTLGTYRKTHIPHDPAFFEQNYFSPSQDGYKIFETNIRGNPVKIGVLICYDQWFPEAARTLALMGADIIFYPTAIGTVKNVIQSEGNWQDAWKTVQRGHAIANATVVAAVNRVGTEGDSIFWGGSFICDAFGRILAEGTNREEIVTAQVNFSHNKQVKDGWRFFKERRPETYSLITKAK